MPGRHAWTLNEADSQPFLRQALDLGINFFDTANVYSSGDSEAVVGRFLKANTRRESVVHRAQVSRVQVKACGSNSMASEPVAELQVTCNGESFLFAGDD